jgi:hypothetical protein
VTYQGRPVPAGQILFVGPADGNPSGLAVIKNGTYHTLPGHEPAGGRQVVRLQLCDGVGSDMSPQGQPMAPLQQVEITLEASEKTRDFHLP